MKLDKLNTLDFRVWAFALIPARVYNRQKGFFERVWLEKYYVVYFYTPKIFFLRKTPNPYWRKYILK